MIDTLRVLQWNAARSLAAIHSLTPLIANNPQPPHLLLIQEPPWYQIGTQPSLTDRAKHGQPIQPTRGQLACEIAKLLRDFFVSASLTALSERRERQSSGIG